MGFRGKYKNKRDGNEPEIFKELLDAGIAVYPTDKPLDAVCGFGGATYLIEVKNGPQAPLTEPQENFLNDWPGHAVVLTSQEEARVWAESITATYGGEE